jgi:hypothetical protein
VKDLTVPDSHFVGAFRGEPGPEHVQGSRRRPVWSGRSGAWRP